jgi:hypothetical protein
MNDAPGPTYCRDCDNVTARTRSLDGWRWRCLMYPVEDMHHFLGEGVRAMEPHGRCLDRNAFGRCDDFTPRREAAHG